MQNKSTIGFIGAGNMTYAIIKGLLNSGYNAKNIKISDIDKSLLKNRKKELGIETYAKNTELVVKCDIVFLAVKPEVMSILCKELQGAIKPTQLLVSIAAGIKVNDICRWLEGEFSLVRTMPNTPALVKQGATGLFANNSVSEDQKAFVTSVLSTISDCFWVDEEKTIDIITAISGSGPAYFFLMIESITQVGISLGLDEKTANVLSIKTALGASVMATNSDKDLKHLRADITSTKGTTQAAIDSLQDQNFEGIIANAVRAAFDRAQKLSSQMGDVE